MNARKSKDSLISTPENIRPHVVLLGAGASVAAFPEGDRNGKCLPVMSNFAQVLELEQYLKDNNLKSSGNFEDIYSDIVDTKVKEIINEKIYLYFSELQLPDKVTDYDRLLLSLREKDAIFTFNWDPFLADAYLRNNNIDGISLPEIFFLHGNVRVVACPNHYKFSFHPGKCDECGSLYERVPLLYPIRKKDYFNSVNYIKVSWEEAENRFTEAFTMTVFGYAAPSSDVEAVELLKNSWLMRSPREMEHVEIIDIADNDVLAKKWQPFAPTSHYAFYDSIKKSSLWKWPRRSCESSLLSMSQGIPCEELSLPETEDLNELRDFIKEISKFE